MTKRQSLHGWLSLASAARKLGQKRLARQCLKEARETRYCPYHGKFDALKPLPGI